LVVGSIPTWPTIYPLPRLPVTSGATSKVAQNLDKSRVRSSASLYRRCAFRHRNGAGTMRELQISSWRPVEVRSCPYLNNIVEQDHRAIKRRFAPMLALKSFRTAAITLAGVELAHRIRKRQFKVGSRGPHQCSSLKRAWARGLACNPDAAAARKPVVDPPSTANAPELTNWCVHADRGRDPSDQTPSLRAEGERRAGLIPPRDAKGRAAPAISLFNRRETQNDCSRNLLRGYARLGQITP
jgi:hypothetical protein